MYLVNILIQVHKTASALSFKTLRFNVSNWSNLERPSWTGSACLKMSRKPPVAPPPPPPTNPSSHRKNSHSTKFHYCSVWVKPFCEYFLLFVFSLQGRLCFKCCFNDPSWFDSKIPHNVQNYTILKHQLFYLLWRTTRINFELNNIIPSINNGLYQIQIIKFLANWAPSVGDSYYTLWGPPPPQKVTKLFH